MYMNTTAILPLQEQGGLHQFEKQARQLAAAARKGREELLLFVQQHFPVFLHLHEERKMMSESFSAADAQRIVARSYGFESWAKLAEFIARISQPDSEVLQFESAVNAIITGDIATLGSLLRNNPELVHLRSMRLHHATLLHYVSANGVEGYRRQSPVNIVAITRLLLAAGAEVDAPYPGMEGEDTVLGLVAAAGNRFGKTSTQIELMETLLGAGAKALRDEPVKEKML